MTTADLGFPILFTILVLWGIFAILGIVTTLMKNGKLPGSLNKVFHRHRHHGHSHRRPSH